jgi:hypothetical protein
MEGEKDRFVGFWQLLMSAGFAASFVTIASYLLIPNAPLSTIVGGVVGIPTGVAGTSAKTTIRALARAAGMWAVILGLFGAIIAYKSLMHGPSEALCPYLAFVSTLISIVALSAGCSQIFCRAVALGDNQAPWFQFSLAEALALSVVFAICLGSAIWWKQQAPEVIDILASPGMRTLSSGG